MFQNWGIAPSKNSAYIDVSQIDTYYISTIARIVLNITHLARNFSNMQEKQAAGIFLEIFIVMVMLGTLSAIAIPHIGQMIGKAGDSSREAELHNIQTAVIQMMVDSDTGTLEPAGPTADMSQVRTTDMPPLVLKDYLRLPDGDLLKSGYTYTFTTDGKVTQIIR